MVMFTSDGRSLYPANGTWNPGNALCPFRKLTNSPLHGTTQGIPVPDKEREPITQNRSYVHGDPTRCAHKRTSD